MSDKYDYDDKALDFGWEGDAKQMLYDLYWEEELSMKLIGKLLGMHPATVGVAMRRYGVPNSGYQLCGGKRAGVPRHNFERRA
jgi:hypothetical protein